MGMSLLLVEDDRALAASLAEELRDLGHQVMIAGDGPAALDALGGDYFDAAILDRMLPALDGISVLERVRRDAVSLPIIMLSALGLSSDKIEGLEAGADDYVVKPVPASELLARINAVRRGRQWTTSEGDMLRAGSIVVSPTRFRAWRSERPVDLCKLEFELLAELARNADAVMTRSMLLQRVWGYDFEPATNILDVYIRRLRIRLMAHGEDDPIATVRGIGYMLRA